MNAMRKIIKKIGKCIKIQDSQCNMMVNIVQDLLDIGQIKAKRFMKQNE